MKMDDPLVLISPPPLASSCFYISFLWRRGALCSVWFGLLLWRPALCLSMDIPAYNPPLPVSFLPPPLCQLFLWLPPLFRLSSALLHHFICFNLVAHYSKEKKKKKKKAFCIEKKKHTIIFFIPLITTNNLFTAADSWKRPVCVGGPASPTREAALECVCVCLFLCECVCQYGCLDEECVWDLVYRVLVILWGRRSGLAHR